MNIVSAMVATSAILASMSVAFAGAHVDTMRQVSTFKPMAGFNQVVSGVRFVGYFLPGPDRCDVTLFQANADDESLTTPPHRVLLQIAAGGRSEIDAGSDSALAIACTIDADAIKIAPQIGRIRSAGL